MFFTSIPDGIVEKQYYFLGQLCALSVVYIGQGPGCFHPAVVEYIFKSSLNYEIQKESVSNLELSSLINKIEQGDNSPLLDVNIIPEKNESNISKFMKQYCLISR